MPSGQTQNNHEPLNGVIWKQWSKDVFVGWSTLEMGDASAAISFNDGQSGILKVMENLSMNRIQVKIVPDIVMKKEIILELKKWERNQPQKKDIEGNNFVYNVKVLLT